MARHAFDEVQHRLLTLYEAQDDASQLIAERREQRIRAEQRVNTLHEEHVASSFFARLSPVCCPRCETPITDDRRKTESAEGACAVCATQASPSDDETREAERIEAKRVLEETKLREEEAKQAQLAIAERLKSALADRQTAASNLNKLRELGSDLDVDVLQKRRERLHGMLEIVKAVAGADLADAKTSSILQAALQEAESRVTGAAAQIFERASAEITRIVKTLGMLDVDRVELKRNAHVDIHKGASVSGWGNISPGERLRLRIATVVALMRTAKQFGTGRHPGLLLIDSPGNEEMESGNLEDLLKELTELAAADNVQLFVALRGTQYAVRAIPSDRLLAAYGASPLW